MKRLTKPTILVLGSLLTAGVAGAAQHEHGGGQSAMPAMPAAVPEDALAKAEKTLKVGKKGDVKFSTETLVGDLRLKPGSYQLQHRMDGSDHFVHFTKMSEGRPQSAVAQAGEVKCRLEPLNANAKVTAVYTRPEGSDSRVTKVLIQGENVAHVF